MQIKPTSIPGCFLVDPDHSRDHRGEFTKMFRASRFREGGLEDVFTEQYTTVSQANVIRGMHFQVPPHDHAKLVSCPAGKVLDVIVDVRRKSPTYGRHEVFTLGAGAPQGVYVARGVAHGFLVVEAPAFLVYMTSSEHAPEYDAGIRWDSFGFEWPVANPNLSPRDAGLPRLADFVSPF
jgi:dTDP-4-dehydrorhamnose 3,5-epimerase